MDKLQRIGEFSNISRMPIVRKQQGVPANRSGRVRKMSPVRLSDDFFLARGGKPTREEAAWMCPQCGVIEPKEYANGFLPGKCDCQGKQLEQYNQQIVTQQQISQEQALRTKRCGSAYTWLGPDLSVGMADTLTRLTFENFIHPELQADAYLAALNFVSNPVGNLIFWGESVGTGKTHIATAIGNALLAENIPVLWAIAQDLFTAFSARMDDHKGYTDLLMMAGSYDVLIIDELSSIAASNDWLRRSFLDVLNKRYMRRLSTVITTNARVTMTRTDIVGISEYIGVAAASRLAAQDNGGVTIVEMNGEDYRRRK